MVSHYAIALFQAVAPFWESKPPQQWSEQQLAAMFRESPWAQDAMSSGRGAGSHPIPVYLASARPMREAEAELTRRRSKGPPPQDPLREEYEEFLREEGASHIVVAVPMSDFKIMADSGETQRMVEESRLRIGRRKYKLAGHFPPTPSDPVLRLVFPKEIRTGDKDLSFELYVPGAPQPYREAVFALKTLTYKGTPEL